MKMPKNVLIIGTADFLRYTPKKNSRTTSRTLTDYLLACNRTYTTLYMFPNVTTGAKKTISDKRGKQRGYIHTEIEYDIPAVNLRAVGTVSAIQYCSDWWRGRMAKWEHVFEYPPTLYADKYSRFRVMAISGRSGQLITEDGIDG